MGTWRGVVEELSDDLTESELRQWATKLGQVYESQSGPVEGRSAKDVLFAADVLAILNIRQGVSVTDEWIASDKTFEKSGVNEYMRILVFSMYGKNDEEKEALAREALKKLETRSMTTGDWVDVVWVFSQGGAAKESRKVLLRVYQITVGTEAARQKADPAELMKVSLLLFRGGMTGTGKGYRELAQAWAHAITSGSLTMARREAEPHLIGAAWRQSFVGRCFGTEKSRQPLLEVLVDSKGMPRLPAAKILSWSYVRTKQKKQWIATLDAYLADAKTDDARALWLMARAHVECLSFNGVSNRDGLRFVSKAFKVATSEPVRAMAVMELVSYQARLGHIENAVSMLSAVESQFSSELRASIIAERDALWRRHLNDQRGHTAAVMRTHTAAQESRIKYYQRQLRRATASGDTAKAERLEQQIESLTQAK
jgi:hypothetical protein